MIVHGIFSEATAVLFDASATREFEGGLADEALIGWAVDNTFVDNIRDASSQDREFIVLFAGEAYSLAWVAIITEIGTSES